MKSTEYSVNSKILNIVTTISGGIGFFVFICAVYTRTQKGMMNTLNDWLLLFFYSAIIGGTFPLTLAVASTFKLRISGQFIEQVFLDRKILKRKSIMELDNMKFDRMFSAVRLYFKDGSTMSLFVLPLWDRAQLQSELEKILGHSLSGE